MPFRVDRCLSSCQSTALLPFLAFLFACWACLPSLVQASGLVQLKLEADPGDQVRVDTTLSANGSLKIRDDRGELQSTPISVTGKFNYAEHVVHPTPHGLETIRQYTQASAKIQVAGETSTNQLAENRRILAIKPAAESVTIFAPGGPLTRDELELVTTPGNTALLGLLLPAETVATDDSYMPSPEIMARLLTIDAVQESTVECKVTAISSQQATVKFAGDVDGAVQGVSTKIELAGQLRFNISTGQIDSAQLDIKEQRAITHVAPGFEMTAKVNIRISPINRLASSQRRQIPRLQPKEADLLLMFDAASLNLRLLHDRRWHVTSQRRLGAVMRLVDAGEMVAQCNLSRLPASEEEESIALADFREHVQQAVGKQQGQIVEAGTATTDHGNRILRIEAAGTVAAGSQDELPVTWIYYHVTSADGRRAMLVFTLETAQLERFDGNDHQLVGNMTFAAAQQAQGQSSQDDDAQSSPVETRAARAIVYPRRPLRSR